MKINWNKEKNVFLKETRGFGFEDIEQYILKKRYITIIKNKNYSDQLIFILKVKNYIYCVPFVLDEKKEIIFLKTIYPSRKYAKIYLEGEKSK
jgi:uncharacterized DUF497 family protein